MKPEFCHLHVHTEHSLLDSLCPMNDLFAEAGKSGVEVLAITDHHSLSGAISFYQKAKEFGIKPVIGVELNVGTIMSDDMTQVYHIIALAKNNLGYTNLLKLLTRSNLTNDNLVTRSMLEEHKQGLIILSGCRESELNQRIVADYAGAKEVALEYRNIFGQNNYYLELQRAGLPGEEEEIRLKVQLARELNLPLVATNNVHYVKREDTELYQILSSVQRLSFEEIYPKKLREEYYFKHAVEMQVLFQDLPEAIENTVHIAERCNIFLDFEQMNFPHFPVPGTMTAESYLLKNCQEALLSYDGPVSLELVQKRLAHELALINQSGYAGYFLIIWDLVHYARSQGIVVTGRGSAAGSLVCYLLGITPVDPMQYGLSFERFLIPERTMLPDIDLDLDHQGRNKVIQYIMARYGEDNVAHISMFSPLTSFALIRDVALAQGWPGEQSGLLGRMISRENIRKVDTLTNSPAFKEAYAENLAFQKLIKTVQRLDGLPRHLTQHPTGLVITRDSLTNYTPLQYARDGEVITQYDLHTIQTLGLFKLDLLGVRFLTVLGSTVESLRKRRGLQLDLRQIPVNDHKVYRLLQRGDTLGCFELEADSTRKMLQKLKPVCLQEIAFALVLSHLEESDPGGVQDFLARLHEVEEVEYFHPALSSILEETYGIILFQEQVMNILKTIADFTPGETEDLRRAMVRKDRVKIAEHKCKFVRNATAHALTAAEANYVYDKLYRNARFTFCKAHVITCAWLAYLSAYLKAHYPLEYITALINTYSDVDYRFRRYLHQARYQQMTILPVDINQSEMLATIINEKIRLGFLGVKGVGEKGAAEIIEKRQCRDFDSLEDFCQRIDVRLLPYTAVEYLVKAGAFDAFGLRKDLLREVRRFFV